MPTAPVNPEGAGKGSDCTSTVMEELSTTTGESLGRPKGQSCGFYLYSPNDAGEKDRSQLIHRVLVRVDSLAVLNLLCLRHVPKAGKVGRPITDGVRKVLMSVNFGQVGDLLPMIGPFIVDLCYYVQ